MNPNDANRRMTGFLIHGFALAHAAAAALLSQTVVGDEAVLTALTIAMIIAVAKMNGASWDAGQALAFLGIFAGYYIGTRGAMLLVKIIPGIGNAANAVVTFGTTEVLGWLTYLFVSKGLEDPSKLSKDEKDKLWNEAKKLQKEEKEESKALFEKMTDEDKAEYDKIIAALKKKDLDDDTRAYFIERMEKLANKYANN